MGTLGGSQSNASALNDNGVAVGYSHNASSISRAFVWDAENGIQDLGALADGWSWAYDVNNAGQVVGSAREDNVSIAVLWDPAAGLVDLNDWLAPDSGWVLREARGINQRGDIVGYGYVDGEIGVRAFLLKAPIVEADAEPVAATYDGDVSLSTEGAPTAAAELIVTLRAEGGEVMALDGEEVVFNLTAEGHEPIQTVAYTEGGVAWVLAELEPGVYSLTATVTDWGLSVSATIEVFNPKDEFTTSGGWVEMASDGSSKKKPNGRPAKAHFQFHVDYHTGGATFGRFGFITSDGSFVFTTRAIEQLVITEHRIVDFRGRADIKGEEGWRFEVHAVDNGQPGRGSDTFEIRLWAPGAEESEAPAATIGGVLRGGNIQMHEKCTY